MRCPDREAALNFSRATRHSTRPLHTSERLQSSSKARIGRNVVSYLSVTAPLPNPRTGNLASRKSGAQILGVPAGLCTAAPKFQPRGRNFLFRSCGWRWWRSSGGYTFSSALCRGCTSHKVIAQLLGLLIAGGGGARGLQAGGGHQVIPPTVDAFPDRKSVVAFHAEQQLRLGRVPLA